MQGTLCLAWGAVFDRGRDRGIVCVFFFMNGGGSACKWISVYTHAHTHTHTAHGVLRCEPGPWQGRDEIRIQRDEISPEESRWTKSWHICIRICVQIAHADIYAGRWNEILDWQLFCFNIFFNPEKKIKRCEVIPRTRIHLHLNYIDPPLRIQKYF